MTVLYPGAPLSRHDGASPAFLGARSLVELLRARAAAHPERLAFRFLENGEVEKAHLTYGEVDRQARAVAALLQTAAAPGERALLLYPSDLAYVTAFLGCLYAGIVAVPAYPPRPNRPPVRVQAILADARPSLVLTTAPILAAARRWLPEVPGGARWLTTDSLDPDLGDRWSEPVVGADTLAFLQYTSGSTQAPRGVMLTHANLLHNLAVIHEACGTSAGTVIVCWLPLYHDMGLIGCVLSGLFCGGSCTLMPPAAFLQRPLRWLEAISRYRGTCTTAPDFAFDLCARKAAPEQRDGLDLSSLVVACNGSEPIRPETLGRFTEQFAPCGFRRETFLCCYGLAEATLMVTGCDAAAAPVLGTFDGKALLDNRVCPAEAGREGARVLVGSGTVRPGQSVLIVDPETMLPSPPDRVGEIWAAGPNVAQGYWERPDLNDLTFRARLPGDDTPYLRTGDLGFLHDGELYVTGRLKDLILIRGHNYYPQDIEWTVEQAHPALRPGAGAAFSIDPGGEERLVVVQELERHGRDVPVEEVVRAVRQAVADEHELDVHAVCLLRAMSIPRTSSAKIQRHACRTAFLDNGFAEEVGRWVREDPPARSAEGLRPPPARRAETIQAWLVERLARHLRVPASAVDPRQPFAHYGLNSVQAVGLSGELQDWLGRPLEPTLLYAYPTIETLARHLAETPAGESIEENGGAPFEPIAVIGMGCRFPGGADSPEAYWRLLREGVDAVSEVPADRWDVDAYYDPDPEAPGKTCSRWGAFLREVDRFDAGFFNISPREATAMDPQQRLLLEVAWEALEDAGTAPDTLAGSATGVFVGISIADYMRLQDSTADSTYADPYTATGSSFSVAAGRLSYVLGLQGPALVVDTACSSSLVALHLACRSLALGESRMALVGGVNLILSPMATIGFSKARMLAPDGRCKTFDARADGFVRGEGCGVVVLKRLADAVRDGDRIQAVVRGTAVNQDGRSNGLTAPNGLAQEAVIRRALAAARVAPADVGYVEAHGTGTALGDPIELQALGAVLGAGRPADRPLVVGSVKTNIGHLESAAGMAGLVKVVLACRHGEVPPHLHFEEPNPYVPWDRLAIVVAAERRPWPAAGDGRRLAGLSSFGFSGTNAHVVVEGAPALPPAGAAPDRPLHLLAVSARGEEALRELARRWADHLAGHPGQDLGDVCHTANTGRAHLPERLAVVAGSLDQMRDRLAAFAAGERPAGSCRGSVSSSGRPRVAFLFTGQGSQYAGMGRRLYQTQPIFRAALDRCAEALRPHLDRPLPQVMYPADGGGSLLDRTGYAQPALFALEHALTELWRSWGVEPAAVLGHSVGEFAAACAAGVFSPEDGLALIAARGRLMQSLPPGGAMAAVFAPEERVAEALAPHNGALAVACLNGPDSVVVSGEATALEEVLGRLAATGVRSQRLAVSHAFHSPLMDPILDDFERAARAVTYSPPRLGLVANVPGRTVTDGEVGHAGYWRRHAREPVRFAEGVRALAEQGIDVFVEVGPGPTLLGMARRCLPEVEALWLPSLRRGRDDWQQILESLAALYTRGVRIDWAGLDRGCPRRRLRLPTYPFQRQRFWKEGADKGRLQALAVARGTAAPAARGPADAGGHPLLGRRLRLPALKDVVFESRWSAAVPAFLGDHCVLGTPMFPAAGYLEMAAAAGLALGNGPHAVEDLVIEQPLVLSAGATRTVQLVLAPPESGTASFQVLSLSDNEEDHTHWTRHAAGKLRVGVPASAGLSSLQPAKAGTPTPTEIRERCPEEIAVASFYERLREQGLEYGPAFRWVEQLLRGAGEALARLAAPEGMDPTGGGLLHPGLLDSCFQVLAVLVPAGSAGAYVPVAVESFRLEGRPGSRAWCHARLRPGANSDGFAGDLALSDEEGRIIARVDGLHVRRAPADLFRRLTQQRVGKWLWELAWQPQPRTPGEAAEPAGRWLIFADRSGVGTELARVLAAAGSETVLVQPDGIDLRRPADFERAVAEAVPCRGVLFLWNLDLPADGDPDGWEAAQLVGCGGLLHLAQALVRQSGGQPPRLVVVTRGAQAVGPGSAPVVEQAPAWGLGRVVALEHPELRCLRVDLDPAAPAAEVQELAAELIAAGREDQVAFRGGTRHVARLVPLAFRGTDLQSVQPEDGLQIRPMQTVRLEIPTRGVLENLAFRSVPRPRPGPGEVLLRVRATGLNFRDVLNVLGMYPGDPGPLGGECSGTVEEVGAGVEGLAIGEEVFGLAPASFATFALTRAEFVVSRPAGLSPAQAAAIPVVFLTAHYAFNHLARLRPGERVLVHAASGGVGLAALQMARRAGAEVFATAGSPAKRAYIESLGIRKVFGSRSLDFAEGVREATGGEGVDVVLNSLRGEFIPRSLELLRPGGRFLEIGKTDLWDAERVAQVNPHASYFAIALDRMMAGEPALVGRLLREVLDDFRAGLLQPLPVQTFSIRDALPAFRHLAQARHIGKVVLTQDAAEGEAPAVRPDGSYLVTGGLGALGLRVARRLVERGARHLVLAGRGEPSAEARAAVAEMERVGARVVAARADVARPADVSRLLAEAATLAPLRGVVHAAGVLDDGALVQQSWPRFAAVLASKLAGARNLDRLSRGQPLDFFVCFSSAASLLGSPGQGNYAAANAALDALAQRRRAEGLPALSVNWGPWAGGGMAAGWGGRGITPLPPEMALDSLEFLLGLGVAQAAVLAADWDRFRESFPPGREPAWLGEQAGPKARRQPADAGAFLRRLQGAPVAERRDLVLAHLQGLACQVLGGDPSRPPDPHRPLHDLGLDSLMAVELRNGLNQALDRNFPATLLFEHPTLEALAGFLAAELFPEVKNPSGPGGHRSQTDPG